MRSPTRVARATPLRRAGPPACRQPTTSRHVAEVGVTRRGGMRKAERAAPYHGRAIDRGAGSRNGEGRGPLPPSGRRASPASAPASPPEYLGHATRSYLLRGPLRRACGACITTLLPRAGVESASPPPAAPPRSACTALQSPRLADFEVRRPRPQKHPRALRQGARDGPRFASPPTAGRLSICQLRQPAASSAWPPPLRRRTRAGALCCERPFPPPRAP